MNELDNNSTLLNRVIHILENARANVVRSVNNQMVLAYWLIGREIVLEIQNGKERATYGKQLIDKLSEQLQNKYKRGFSTTNLRYFRSFYQAYADRSPEIRHIASGESDQSNIRHTQGGVSGNIDLALNENQLKRGFSPELGWTHYRRLMQVENQNERLFYEIEAEKENWDVPMLERQANTHLFARLLKSKDKDAVLKLSTKGQEIEKPADTIKSPYIFDFLGIAETNTMHESELESAIIENLQAFLLELGKGFAFVGRQKRMQFDDKYFYIDLVFYNCILKCYLLIDLKLGELTHQDVGQMDSYVRMFDDKYIVDGDNPTIGLILCAKENQTIAKYSVLNQNKQLFASKYMLYLPTEEELKRELHKLNATGK